jgi:tRNA (guanine-N7-)-methyltransferase
MARKNKLTKFSEILTFPNVVENYEPKIPKLLKSMDEEIDLKGRWKRDFFKNENKLVVELACGRGEYTVALGRDNPNVNFLGVDIKGARIWKGAKQALTENLTNIGFLRCKIEMIEHFFTSEEIDEIWITFPDPFHAKENRRLTSHRFLDIYKRITSLDALIHLKTDDDTLYEWSIESLKAYKAIISYQSSDIYSAPLVYSELTHKTYYEVLNLRRGKTIKYIRFCLPKT